MIFFTHVVVGQNSHVGNRSSRTFKDGSYCVFLWCVRLWCVRQAGCHDHREPSSPAPESVGKLQQPLVTLLIRTTGLRLGPGKEPGRPINPPLGTDPNPRSRDAQIPASRKAVQPPSARPRMYLRRANHLLAARNPRKDTLMSPSPRRRPPCSASPVQPQLPTPNPEKPLSNRP